MADVSQLGLDAPDSIDYDNYDDGGGGSSFLPPTVGEDGENVVFTLQVGKDISFSKAQTSGKLMAKIDSMKVVGPCDCEASVNYTYVSSKQWERNGKTINVSQMGNFLRSAGISIPKGATNQVLADACDATKNQNVRAVLDWVAYDKATDKEYIGFSNFPLSTANDGTRHPGLKPGSTFGDGTPVTNPLRANLKVRWFVGVAA